MYCSDVKEQKIYGQNTLRPCCVILGRYTILDNSHKLPELVGLLGKIKTKIRIIMMMVVVMMTTLHLTLSN